VNPGRDEGHQAGRIIVETPDMVAQAPWCVTLAAARSNDAVVAAIAHDANSIRPGGG